MPAGNDLIWMIDQPNKKSKSACYPSNVTASQVNMIDAPGSAATVLAPFKARYKEIRRYFKAKTVLYCNKQCVYGVDWEAVWIWKAGSSIRDGAIDWLEGPAVTVGGGGPKSCPDKNQVKAFKRFNERSF